MLMLRTICPSAHLDSFCRALHERCKDFEMVYQTEPGSMRRKIGWKMEVPYPAFRDTTEKLAQAEQCEILVEMLRELDLMQRRLRNHLRTIYVSERWFKPLRWRRIVLPGIARLLIPGYFRMARRFVRMMDDPNFWVFPCGVHAVGDFVRMHKIFHGDWRALFRKPQVRIDRQLGGVVWGYPRIRLWCYFVEKSTFVLPPGFDASKPQAGFLKILWCGRMLDWKRVDVLVRAFVQAMGRRRMALLLVGEGKELFRLRKLAGNCAVDGLQWHDSKISFNGFVSSEKVRELMRQADVYVMPSDAGEGWGAAISDACAEGCPVISTHEAGSSATVLDERWLYHAARVDELVDKLVLFRADDSFSFVADAWTGEKGALKFLETLNGNY